MLRRVNLCWWLLVCVTWFKRTVKDHPPSNLLARPFSDGNVYATPTSKVVRDMKLRDERSFVITRIFCDDCYVLQHVLIYIVPLALKFGGLFLLDIHVVGFQHTSLNRMKMGNANRFCAILFQTICSQNFMWLKNNLPVEIFKWCQFEPCSVRHLHPGFPWITVAVRVYPSKFGFDGLFIWWFFFVPW